MKQLEHTGVGYDWGLSALTYNHYGYWHEWAVKNRRGDGLKGYEWLPRWYIRALREAKQYAKVVKPADLQLKIDLVTKEGPYFITTYRIVDRANPQIKPWESRVQTNTRQAGLDYARTRFSEIGRLYEGDNAVWLQVRKTGIPYRPDWNTNESDSYGYKWKDGKIVKTYIPTLKEALKGERDKHEKVRHLREEKML